MLLVSPFPFIIGWSILNIANSISVLYIAFTLLALGEGLVGMSIIYVAEIRYDLLKILYFFVERHFFFDLLCSESTLRAILLPTSLIFNSAGLLITFVLGSFLSWRKTALICVVFPVILFFAAIFVCICILFVKNCYVIVKKIKLFSLQFPESQMWLLSKQRPDDALKSLQFYRGWVPAQNVESEFKQLQRFCDWTNACTSCQKMNKKCVHLSSTSTFCDKFKEMMSKRVLKPLTVIVLTYVFFLYSATTVMRPYIVSILNAYGISIDAYVITIFFGVLGILGSICTMFAFALFGKRKVYLFSLFATALCCLGLSN